MIKTEIIYSDKTCMQIRLFDIKTSVVNSLRRIMISQIPTMAIDMLEIQTNTSVIHDETLAHRFGLIPLTSSTVDTFVYPEECKCGKEWCEHCGVEFTLFVKYDESRAVNGIQSITTKDLKSSNPYVVPVDILDDENHTVLTKIRNGQELQIRAIARKGTQKIHAKWCPVTTATYVIVPKIVINENHMNALSSKQKQEFVNACPTKVFTYTEDDKVVIQDIESCLSCGECTKKAECFQKPNLIRVRQTNNFVMDIETNGQLDPKEIFDRAVQINKVYS